MFNETYEDLLKRTINLDFENTVPEDDHQQITFLYFEYFGGIHGCQ